MKFTRVAVGVRGNAAQFSASYGCKSYRYVLRVGVLTILPLGLGEMLPNVPQIRNVSLIGMW